MGARFNRREFLKGTGALAVVSLLPINRLLPASPKAKTIDDVTAEFIKTAQDTGGTARWGYRLSNAWSDAEGFSFTVYQRAIFEKVPDGQINLRNILDELSVAGYDQDLYKGTYGIVVPRREESVDQESPIVSFDILKELSEIKKAQLNPGQFTSSLVNFGPFEVVRLQALALQKWYDGKREGILIGDAYQKMGLIPQEALLDIPQTDDDDLLGCGRGPTWEGIASYYSKTKEGCLGCSLDYRMSNNEIFDDRKPTLAFMRTPLDIPVLVENPATGISIRAMVTDRGGFERKGRIADLSLGLRDAIGGSDLTRVRITLLSCP